MEASIFNTKTRMNPRAPETAEYFDRDQVAYVFRASTGDRHLVATSFGVLGYEVGDRVELISDQSRRTVGGCTWLLIGIRRFSNGEVEGEVTSRKVNHWVFK
jgi:hypothetical protein